MDLRLLGSIVILSTVTLTVVRSLTTSTTVATNSTTVATTSTTVATTSTTVATTSTTVATTSKAVVTTPSLESPSTSGTVSLSSFSKTSSSVNPSSSSIRMIITSSSVATTTSEPVVPPLSSSFTSAAAHTTSEGGSQSVSPTTLSQTIQGTKVLSNTPPSSSVKISVTTKAEISPSAHSPGRTTSKSVTQQQRNSSIGGTTSKSVTQQQLNSSIGGTTSHISPLRQSDSLTSSASLGVSSQPGPSSVSPTLTVSSSLHQERANSTVVTRTTRNFAPTTQALMSSPSTSFHCTEFTVFEEDCSKACSNVGGTVEATEWCPSYSTVPANPKSNRTKPVPCEVYCSGTEAFRSLLSTVIVGILPFMISQLI